MIAPEQLDTHLAAAIGLLVDHAGGVREHQDGVLVLAVGRGGPEFNAGFVMTPPRDPGATMRWAADRLGAVGRPSMVQLRDGFRDTLAPALASAGWPAESTLPGMAREVVADVPPPPDGLRVVPVRDADELETFAVTTARGFGAPDPQAMSGVLAPTLLDDDRVAMLTGYAGGRPVATAVSVVAEGLAGIYAVTVDESVRRRGYGEAMTWAAVAAGARPGITHTVLQATAMGEPVYRRMGFATVCGYHRFAPAPAGS